MDGDYHLVTEQKEYDLGREYELKELGITVLRFTNAEIETRLSEVLQKIITIAEARL